MFMQGTQDVCKFVQHPWAALPTNNHPLSLLRAREIKEEIEERLEDDDEDAAGGPAGRASLTDNGLPGPSLRGGGGSSGPSRPAMKNVPKVNGTVPRGFQGASGGYGSLQQEMDQGRRQQPWLQPSGTPSGQGMTSLPLAAAGEAAAAAHGIPPPPPPPGMSKEQRQKRVQDLRTKFDRARLSELRSKFGWGDRDRGGGGTAVDGGKEEQREARRGGRGGGSSSMDDGMMMGAIGGREDLVSRLEGSVDDIQEAQEALEEMVEAEEEEQEVEEVEDLLEYYLQKASATQDEAERLLAG